MTPERHPKLLPAFILTALATTCTLSASIGCDPLCGNDVLTEHRSPDGTMKAVVFVRNCGATTSYSTQLSILDADDSLPAGAGNTFIADTDHGRVLPGPGGGPAVEVVWTGKQSLAISFAARIRVFKQESSVDGIHIEYEATR